MLLVSDSCAAYTIFDRVDEPNLIMIGSSSKGQYSYSLGRDSLIDTPKTDR
jgi:Glycosylphosphatidylinositol transamidase (GPIT), subunit GPI8